VIVPNPVRIFHITAIANLPSIAKAKALLATTEVAKKKIVCQSIAYQSIQGRRALKMVARPPGGVLHDYVPFYFAPRSPMLFTINSGNVPSCPYRQTHIVHLATTVDLVTANGLTFVFYDHNATLGIAACYNNLNDLDKIDWPLFHEQPQLDGYCKYWQNRYDDTRYIKRMETRQAEFLVHRGVPLTLIQTVGTYDNGTADQVREVFKTAGVLLNVEAKPEWYFS